MTATFFTTLAFGGFASLGFLGWATLGAVPIVIHLLHKRRFRETSWAAMRFLLQATRKNARRIRIEQLLLLAIRVLILVLLVCAFARPYMAALGNFFEAEASTHRILVVDTSLSMAATPAERSRYRRGIDMAQQIVASGSQGDAWQLLQINSLPPRAIVSTPSYRRNEIDRELRQLSQTHEVGDVAATLEDVERMLSELPDMTNKEVVIISDFQRENWLTDSSAVRARIAKRLDGIADKSQLVLLNVGQQQTANVAVTSLSVEEALVTVGRPLQIRGTLRSAGRADVVQTSVQLHVDGRLVETKPATLFPDTDVPVTFEYFFAEAGEHEVELRTSGGDALAVDDRRWMSLPVRERLNILLVNGRAAGRPRDEATFYLQQAFEPVTSDQPWEGITQPTVVRDGDLPGVDLDRYDCVFLCDVGLITETEADLLAAYVRKGGGLVISLGERVRAESYNQTLFGDGDGLLPARLGDTQRSPEDDFFLFDVSDLKHPIVNQYAGNPGTGLETTLLTRYRKVEIPEGRGVQRVINFDNGDPAILDMPFGKGHVVLITTALDDTWGVWPVQPQTSFVPIVHETARFVSGGWWADRNLLVGQQLTQSVPVLGIDLTMLTPGSDRVPLRAIEQAGSARWSFDKTSLAGIYRMELGADAARQQYFAVNADPRESRPRTLTQDEIQAELLPGGDFYFQDRWQETRRVDNGSPVSRGGLSRWLLGAVFLLLLIEQLMAWRFVWGFRALVVTVVAALVIQSAAFGIMPALVAIGVIIAVALLLRFGLQQRFSWSGHSG